MARNSGSQGAATLAQKVILNIAAEALFFCWKFFYIMRPERRNAGLGKGLQPARPMCLSGL